jgi:hypothetical protein
MMKTEMTPAQIDKRNLFTNKLISAGWKLDRRLELFFDEGFSVVPEAGAKYQNTAFYLQVSYMMEGGYLLWECVGKNNPIILTLNFYLKANLDSVLAAILAVQDTLSADNRGEFLLTIIPLCAIVLVETSEGFMQVSLPV